MPEIEKIPVVLHDPTDPYHYQFDNLPLQNIIERQRLINAQVDSDAQILRESIGSAGTLSNRLNTSLNANGSLKTAAVDNSLHNIGAHEDGTYDGVNYVRMLEEERTKLSLVSDDATALRMQVNAISNIVLFEDEIVEFEDSDTVAWTVTAPNKVQANLAFPAAAAHLHYYDRIPAHASLTPDYQNYKTTSVSTPFVDGSLRVTINGIRITEAVGIYVPPSSGPSGTWTLTYFTPNYSAGTFSLNRALTSSDVIRIDFDTDFS